MSAILEVEDLRVDLAVRSGIRTVVDGLFLAVAHSEIFGLVGDMGRVALPELEKTFNMGVGMIALVDPASAGTALARLRATLVVVRGICERESASDDLSDYASGRRELADDLLDVIDGHRSEG